MNGAVELYASMWRNTIKTGVVIEAVPYCPQLDDYSCARASLAMVARFYDRVHTLEEAVHLIKVDEDGLTPRQIAEVGRTHFGLVPVMPPHKVKERTMDHLLEVVKKGIPVIVDFGDPGNETQSHSAVLVGYSKYELYFHDPYLRPYFPRPRTKFTKMWDRENRGYVYFEVPKDVWVGVTIDGKIPPRRVV